MPRPKKSGEKITIRGIEFESDFFKPRAFDEGELPGILDALSEISAFANKNCDYDFYPLVNSSPLLRIEGLLRYQIAIIQKDLGLTLEELETTSDFLHENEYVHNHVSSPKAVFLFDFLGDIVFYSDYPALITHHPNALDKIALNLRALSFLVESQITGGSKNKDIAFEEFAYSVWEKLGAKKISAKVFWDKAISTLNNDKNAGEIDFLLPYKNQFGITTMNAYVIRLEEKAGKQVIKSSCENKNIPGGRAKGYNQIKTIWAALQNKFMARKK